MQFISHNSTTTRERTNVKALLHHFPISQKHKPNANEKQNHQIYILRTRNSIFHIAGDTNRNQVDDSFSHAKSDIPNSYAAFTPMQY